MTTTTEQPIAMPNTDTPERSALDRSPIASTVEPAPFNPQPSTAPDHRPPGVHDSEPLNSQTPQLRNSPATDPQIHQSINPRPARRGRNGFVARLPKATRDQINQWIDDGKQYPRIIEDLGDAGKHLNPGHLTSWRQGGYQDYLAHQEWRFQLLELRESGSDVPELAADHKFQETIVQLGLTEIFRILRDGQLQPDSPNYIRLLNALARLNREALNLRKYNDSLAEGNSSSKPQKPPTNEKPELTIDRCFEIATGIKPSPLPIGPDLNHFHSSSSSAPDRREVPIRNRESSILPSAPASPSPVQGSKFEVQSSIVSSDTPAARIPELLNSQTHKFTNSVADNPPIHQSIHPSRGSFRPRASSRERCPQCRSVLPPLLPTGERPSPWCNSCGGPLRLPGALIEYCPGCNAILPELKPDGSRPSPACSLCDQPLPALPKPSAPVPDVTL